MRGKGTHNKGMSTVRMPSRERGAALVVGLIMLLVLTLLAVAGMNTASTELVMAGNEQYRQKAFQAAESGLEQALTVLRTVPQTVPATTPNTRVVGGAPDDQYRTTSTYEGEDLNVSGYSAGKFTAFHYQIDSTGMSSRNANAQHTQGAYIIQNSAGSGYFTP